MSQMIDAAHIDALRHLVGEKSLLVEPADMVAYEIGARYDRGKAAFVVRPESTEDVSAVMACCGDL